MQIGKIQQVIILDRNHSDAHFQQKIIEEYCASAVVHCFHQVEEARIWLNRYPRIPIDLILMDNDQRMCGSYDILAQIEQRALAWTFSPVVIMRLEPETVEPPVYKYSPMVADYIHKPLVPEFFQYLLEFHFDREGNNGLKSSFQGIRPTN